MRSLSVAIFGSLLTATLSAQSPSVAQMETLARETAATWRLPALAVAVVKDDQVMYLEGFGATPDTLFQIASTSKAFTTTAMAMLAAEEKLDWDDPVRKHLPSFRLSDPCADSLLTLRDIVSHRTGLKRHDELWDYGLWSREEIVARVGAVELTKPFRSAYQYNNIMFMTAGEVVEAAAGMPWEDFVSRRIFQPLDMKNTVISEADWLEREHAPAHKFDFERQTITASRPVDYASLGPAGAIKSSARDLARWVRFQLNKGSIDGKRLLSADALTETWEPHTLLASDRENNPVTIINAYGLGWRVQDYRGELLVSHGGALNDYRAQVALLPELRSGVVVLTNINRGYGIIALRNSLLDLLIGEDRRNWNEFYLARDRKENEEEAQTRREREAKRHRDTTPSRELPAYAGTYSDPAYGDVTIRVQDDQLFLDWQRIQTPLTHYHYDTFSGVAGRFDFNEQITFELGADGEVRALNMFGEEFVRKRK